MWQSFYLTPPILDKSSFLFLFFVVFLCCLASRTAVHWRCLLFTAQTAVHVRHCLLFTAQTAVQWHYLLFAARTAVQWLVLLFGSTNRCTFTTLSTVYSTNCCTLTCSTVWQHELLDVHFFYRLSTPCAIHLGVLPFGSIVNYLTHAHIRLAWHCLPVHFGTTICMLYIEVLHCLETLAVYLLHTRNNCPVWPLYTV